MSVIANWFLNMAKSFANSRGSGLAIRIKENDEVEYEYVSKEGTDSIIWENHYPHVGFYLGESANPIRWEIDVEGSDTETAVDAIENSVSTKYYETFMQQEALSRIFNVAGATDDMVVKLLYAILAGITIVGFLVIAVFGNLPA